MQIAHQYERLSLLLSPGVKSRIRQVLPQYLATARGVRSPLASHASAVAALRGRFPLASPAQADFLAFYLLSIAAITEDAKGQADSLGDLTQSTAVHLQMVLSRRSQYAEALSNVMKKIDSTQETIVQNLKG